MTANELADALQETEPYYPTDYKLFDQAATMLRQQQDKLTKYELRHAEQRKRIDELETTLRQQQAEIEALKNENSHLKYEISSNAWSSEELTDQEIFNIYAYQQDTYTGNNFPVAVGRAIIKEAKKK